MGRVLVIDDDKFTCEHYRSELEPAVDQLHCVAFGDEGLQWLEKSECDAIVVDPTSPTADGIALIERLLIAAPAAELVVTINPNQIEIVDDLLRVGVRTILYKPVNPESLLTIARQCIAHRAAIRDSGYRRSQFLFDAVRRIVFSTHQLGFYSTALSVLKNWSNARAGLFWIREPQSDKQILAAEFGLSERKKEKLDSRFQDWVDGNGRTPEPRVIVNPADRREEGLKLPRGYSRGLFVPLSLAGRPRGTVWLLANQRPGWDQGLLPELKLVQQALQQALSILNPIGQKLESGQWDELTRLYGMAGLRRAVDYQIRNKSEGTPVCLLAIDVDSFKKINDIYGHSTGGQCLIEMAHLLRRSIRGADTISRPRADEFFVLLPGCSTEAGEMIAERVRQNIQEHKFLSREALFIQLTATLAVLDVPSDIAKFANFLRVADSLVNLGKQRGRNRVINAEESRELCKNTG